QRLIRVLRTVEHEEVDATRLFDYGGEDGSVVAQVKDHLVAQLGKELRVLRGGLAVQLGVDLDRVKPPGAVLLQRLGYDQRRAATEPGAHLEAVARPRRADGAVQHSPVLEREESRQAPLALVEEAVGGRDGAAEDGPGRTTEPAESLGVSEGERQ